MNPDISHILRSWEYSQNNIRKIVGLDGTEKLQVRLPLGIEQYEIDGRPDGKRPRGKDSLLQCYKAKLERHVKRHGTDEGFALTRSDAAKLREEGVLYYFRYVLFFQIGEYKRTIRDTQLNSERFDLIEHYAKHKSDREPLQEYRPYILRMNRAARALLSAEAGAFDQALGHLADGIRRIESLTAIDNPNFVYERNRSIHILRGMEKEIRARKPLSRAERLARQLQKAVREEDYEKAAKLRDAIRKLESGHKSTA